MRIGHPGSAAWWRALPACEIEAPSRGESAGRESRGTTTEKYSKFYLEVPWGQSTGA